MVRAKMKVVSKSQDEFASSVLLTPVVSSDKESENGKFYKATPGGKCELNVVSQETAYNFEVGKEYYVDFTPAE